MKTIAIGVLLSLAVFFSISASMANQRIVMLEKNAEAHKMAMTFANSAIHEFYNKSQESL